MLLALLEDLQNSGRVFLYGLTDGGPAGLIYGYISCWFGYFTVVASLAELASMYVHNLKLQNINNTVRAPTAGGQYHWVYLLSPPSWRNFLSYMTGMPPSGSLFQCISLIYTLVS